jgi:hypothetical protein
MTDAEPTARDREAIVTTCTDYGASWLEGDRKRMAACLHPGLAKRTMVDVLSGSLALGESPYDEMVASAVHGPRPYERDLRIEIHDISEGIASASVLSEPWLDLVHLAWFGDRWRIVNVLYEPRPMTVDDPADRTAVADLLDAYARSGFDEDAELVLATHHPALAERRVVVGSDGGLELEDTTRDEVVEAVRRGLEMERFERTWEAQVLEVGHDVAAGKVVAGWYDVDLHLARFGDRWMIVNILYRVLPVDP